MELRHLRYLIAVSEAGSLSGASERLHIAQPALSQSIKALEGELGTRLFERSKKGMKLTDAGRVFLPHAQAVLRQVTTAVESVQDSLENPRGTVSLSMSASHSHVLTAPLFEYLRANHPKIELSPMEGLTGDMRARFDQGLTDIMLDFDTEESAEYNVEPLLREQLYFVSPLHDIEKPEISFEQVTRHPLYLPRASIDSMHRQVMRYANTENRALEVQQGTPTMHGTIRLVQRGLGYSVLPWSAIYDLVGNTLTAQKIVKPEIFRKVCMVTHITRPQSNAARCVMEAIRGVVQDAHKHGHWRGELLIGR